MPTHMILRLLTVITLLYSPANAVDLILDYKYKQEGNGTIVYGTTNLPDGTKLGISVEREGNYRGSTKVVVMDGKFESEAFSNKGQKLIGEFGLEIYTYFNGAWHSAEILKKLALYKGKYVNDDHIEVSAKISLNASPDALKKQNTALKQEIQEMQKFLKSLKSALAELNSKVKNPTDWDVWSGKWNREQRKQKSRFEETFGKNVNEYKGLASDAFWSLSLAHGYLFQLWQQHNAMVEGRGKAEDLKWFNDEVTKNIKDTETALKKYSKNID